MTQTAMDSAVPVSERERIAELDVLRGIALFGVLTMNFVAFAYYMMATKGQLEALPTASIDWWVLEAVRIFIGDKANTVFATLFGLGFYIQLTRSEGKPGFERRYARRLFWLLVFGWLNILLLWVWDILNLYALAGFALLFMRRWSTRALLLFGIPAALYSDKLQHWLVGALSLPIPNADRFFTDAAVIERQAVAQSGDYPAIVASFAELTWADWIVGGTMAAWLVYALGRFALGAAIGRSGLFDDIKRHVPLLRRIAWTAIPVGLAMALALRFGVHSDNESVKTFAEILRSPVALILATGYCAGIIVALQNGWGKRLFGRFGAVGRMALTNYLAQGLIYAFVMFRVGPGLGLAGKIGSSTVLLICIVFFAFQVVFSHWWLARFRFGPMEWLWRWLTYGERPAFRSPVVTAQPA